MIPIEELKEKLEKLKKEHIKAEGIIEDCKNKLEDEYKVGTVEEAEALIAQLRRKKDKIQQKIEALTEEFLQKYEKLINSDEGED